MNFLQVYAPYIILLINILFFVVIKFNDFKHLQEILYELKSEIKCMREIQIKHEAEINFLKGKLNGK